MKLIRICLLNCNIKNKQQSSKDKTIKKQNLLALETILNSLPRLMHHLTEHRGLLLLRLQKDPSPPAIPISYLLKTPIIQLPLILYFLNRSNGVPTLVRLVILFLDWNDTTHHHRVNVLFPCDLLVWGQFQLLFGVQHHAVNLVSRALAQFGRCGYCAVYLCGLVADGWTSSCRILIIPRLLFVVCVRSNQLLDSELWRARVLACSSAYWRLLVGLEGKFQKFLVFLLLLRIFGRVYLLKRPQMHLLPLIPFLLQLLHNF